MSNQTLITPSRHARLLIDIDETVMLQPEWRSPRRAQQMSRARGTTGQVSSHVVLQPGGAWTLTYFDHDSSRLTTTAANVRGLTLTDVNAVSSYAVSQINGFRSPSDLTGVTVSGSMISAGYPLFQKQVAGGGMFNQELTADVTARAKPTLPTADVTMQRVISSKYTYPSNAAWRIGFTTHSGQGVDDSLLTFYFGGRVNTLPATAVGGEYCVNFRGNGMALLFEWTGSGGWVQRFTFPWWHGETQGNVLVAACMIIPYGRDTLAFYTQSRSATAPDATSFSLLDYAVFASSMSVGAQSSHKGTTFYRANPASCGYLPTSFVTGAGQVRLDVRQDIRPLISIHHLTPNSTGTLVDLPMEVPWLLPNSSNLYLTLEGYTPGDTSIVPQVYTNTGVALPRVGPIGVTPVWRFTTVGTVGSYYVSFAMAADTVRELTPVLTGYTLSTDCAQTTTRTGAKLSTAHRGINITGPDLTPDHETAAVQVEDPTNALALLRSRAGMRSRIVVNNDAGVLQSVLFEGDIQRADATRKGTPGRTYPNANWNHYDITLTGMWSRLAEQINTSWWRFVSDENAPIDPTTGGRLPWKITDAIRVLLVCACGFPSNQVNIPDWDIRFGAGAQLIDNNADFMLQPGQSISEFVMKLARDYLGSVLLWDPNAGASGQWRLLENPQAPYTNIVGTFRGVPSLSTALRTHPNSYATGETFFQYGSLRTFVQAPEANYVRVVGASYPLPGGNAPTYVDQIMVNGVSFSFNGTTPDPTHPDYLGRIKPIIVVDFGLWGQASVSYACRRIYDLACHGRKWVKFRAPVLLITDSLDTSQTRPRPLRINDQVQVITNSVTSTCLVRSCNPAFDNDGVMMADYELLAVA